MVNRFSDYAKDNFIATAISSFTSADIPDQSVAEDEVRVRLSNFILNVMLGPRPATPDFRLWFLVLRRVRIAFEEYGLARAQTARYLDGASDPDAPVAFGPYFSALHHWEQHLAALWQSFSTLNALVQAMAGEPQKAFAKGDGSVLERLNALHNTAKHAEDRISDGRMPDEGTTAIWLTNIGINCLEASIAYEELADALVELATWCFVIEHPAGSQERLRDLMTLAAASEVSDR